MQRNQENILEFIERFDNIGALINITARHLKARMKQILSSHGINLTAEQWPVIFILNDFEEIGQSELVERLMRDKTVVARIISSLEKKKLIARKIDLNDKRNKILYLTNEGKLLVEKILPITDDYHDMAIKGLSKDDLINLKRILLSINENIF